MGVTSERVLSNKRGKQPLPTVAPPSSVVGQQSSFPTAALISSSSSSSASRCPLAATAAPLCSTRTLLPLSLLPLQPPPRSRPPLPPRSPRPFFIPCRSCRPKRQRAYCPSPTVALPRCFIAAPSPISSTPSPCCLTSPAIAFPPRPLLHSFAATVAAPPVAHPSSIAPHPAPPAASSRQSLLSFLDRAQPPLPMSFPTAALAATAHSCFLFLARPCCFPSAAAATWPKLQQSHPSSSPPHRLSTLVISLRLSPTTSTTYAPD
ncbi:hypothetical protein BHE74_00041969 [Ensete ventricosum]|nr:hypothetical protein BHE74_00041969 [Ensete ventricosum]